MPPRLHPTSRVRNTRVGTRSTARAGGHGGDTLGEESDLPQREIVSPSLALALAALEAAMPAETLAHLRQGKQVSIVLVVPSGEWCRPVLNALHQLSPIRNALEVLADGPDRKQQSGGAEVLAALGRGSSIIGISPAPERYLPSVLVASADAIVRLAALDAAILAAAMNKCLKGPLPNKLPADLTSGLTFEEVVGAFRPGCTAADVIARLEAMAMQRGRPSSTEPVPRLYEAVFYGAARDWGLALAQDVHSARRGEIGWSEVDRGAILHGEPGTGKTWLARMIAAECRLPLIASSVGELFATSSGNLDGVVKAQRAVFERAAARAPCVLFWDEIEAMPHRGLLSARGRDFWMPVVDDFLLQVSSVPPGVIQLGATNYLHLVDPALRRPGRMERAIEIKPPETAEALAGILRFHLGRDLKGLDLVPLARLGIGATAATAMEWVREARRRARASNRSMVLEDLSAVIVPADSRSPADRRLCAVHEAGHAVAALALRLGPIERVSLLRTDVSGGFLTLSDRGRIHDRSSLEALAIAALGGRAAEIVCLGAASAGAGASLNSDLAIATQIITSLHTSFGLAGTLLFRAPSEMAATLLASDGKLRASVEKELQRLHERAIEVIADHRHAVASIADLLMQRHVLTGGELNEVFAATCPGGCEAASSSGRERGMERAQVQE